MARMNNFSLIVWVNTPPLLVYGNHGTNGIPPQLNSTLSDMSLKVSDCTYFYFCFTFVILSSILLVTFDPFVIWIYPVSWSHGLPD